MTAERACAETDSLIEKRLQCGRGQMTAERPTCGHSTHGARSASMWPRSDDRGKHGMAHLDEALELKLQCGRGQMTAESRGNVSTAFSHVKLQCGRGQMTAESGFSAPKDIEVHRLQCGRGQMTAERQVGKRKEVMWNGFNVAAVR